MISSGDDKKDAKASTVGRPMTIVFCAVDLWVFQ